MENILAGIILLIIVGGAIVYIIKEKRKGTKCIGCSAGGKCCHCHSDKKHPKKES